MSENITPQNEENNLPNQEKFFSQVWLRKKARAGTQLPDPKQEPYGYDPKSRFDHIFPRLSLPALRPPMKYHPQDHLSFGSEFLESHELYLGDNLSVLRTIPSESIDLIYIDPPFFSNRTYTQIWGDNNEVRSFGDIFGDGMPSYLAWLNARLWEMKRVLKSTGSIYVHCDWHASHYIKCEMDKIFGYENFRNEIAWGYDRWANVQKNFQRMHDVIFFYSKTDNSIFNEQRLPNENPRKRNLVTMVNGKKVSMRDEFWNVIYKEQVDKPVSDFWEDILPVPKKWWEKIWYPTQKPEKLLERIILTSSNPWDTVADFFMGGGTTGAVAMKLGRRFIGSDISRVAVSVSTSRLGKIGEELSGMKVNNTYTENEQQWLGSLANASDFRGIVPSIRVGYVGSYPVEKFHGMEHKEFADFIIRLYGGVPYTGELPHIDGTANSKLVLSIGDADPEAMISADFVKKALESTLKLYQKQLSEGQEKILQIIGWKFSPEIDEWKRKTTAYLNKNNLKIQIETISVSGDVFRGRIFRVIGESNVDLSFNRLTSMLTFASTPYAGNITITPWTEPKRTPKWIEVSLTLLGARAVGQAKLINTQWDMDMSDGRFADREHALNREWKNGDYTAKLEITHTFGEVNEYFIGGRVQDSMDGEATTTARLRFKEAMDGTGKIIAEIEKLS